ncbi:MAG: hypothetical protein JWP48_5664 [Actinoallomurus sp.]|jgi:hypothetical protein|nr:hypothetical protein [Actinoallomurus sp.]
MGSGVALLLTDSQCSGLSCYAKSVSQELPALWRHEQGKRTVHHYYGHNLDAFNDLLFDIGGFRSHGTDQTTTGTVLALTDYNIFHSNFPRLAHQILDIFASQARRALLGLHPMLRLVQSTHDFEPVGATGVYYG